MNRALKSLFDCEPLSLLITCHTSILLFSFCLLFQGCATPPTGGKHADTIPLREVTNQVTIAVDRFRHTDYAKVAKLKSAEFEFETVKGEGGELDVKPLGIINLGFSLSHEVTHTFTFTYGESKHRLSALQAQKPELTDQLVDMIERAGKSAEKAIYAGGLSLQQVELTVKFGVKWEASVGGEFPFKLVTLGGNVKASRDETQSVKLTFVRK